MEPHFFYRPYWLLIIEEAMETLHNPCSQKCAGFTAFFSFATFLLQFERSSSSSRSEVKCASRFFLSNPSSSLVTKPERVPSAEKAQKYPKQNQPKHTVQIFILCTVTPVITNQIFPVIITLVANKSSIHPRIKTKSVYNEFCTSLTHDTL